MNKIIVILLFFPLFSFAQSAEGIRFEKSLNWPGVLQKARQEHKGIFVDCYATWCGPCKMMDNAVYPNDTVGKYMNDKFISVRLQMDKTDHDDSTVRQWYYTAASFENTYSITAYPTFLLPSIFLLAFLPGNLPPSSQPAIDLSIEMLL